MGKRRSGTSRSKRTLPRKLIAVFGALVVVGLALPALAANFGSTACGFVWPIQCVSLQNNTIMEVNFYKPNPASAGLMDIVDNFVVMISDSTTNPSFPNNVENYTEHFTITSSVDNNPST